MDLLSMEFITALFAIVFIDLVLAGDNAIVIGMAARNLPQDKQKFVIICGTLGAIGIRAAATMVALSLLKIPGLLLVGGLLLVWIAYKLMVEEKKHDVKAASDVWGAIRTIIIADAAMGLDNVIAIAGVAHGSMLLVILGLLISVPIIIWGSTLFIRLINRFPVIIYLGSGILAWTAASMITDERLLSTYFEQMPPLKWTVIAVVTIGVLAAGWMKNKQKQQQSETEEQERKHPVKS